jgi:hypothetical protein
MVKASPANVFLIFLALDRIAMISFHNFYENQATQFTFSFSATNIVEIKALGANLFPSLKDMISVNASSLVTFHLPFILAIRYLEPSM